MVYSYQIRNRCGAASNIHFLSSSWDYVADWYLGMELMHCLLQGSTEFPRVQKVEFLRMPIQYSACQKRVREATILEVGQEFPFLELKTTPRTPFALFEVCGSIPL